MVKGSALSKGTARDRERTSMPAPMLGVQQPVDDGAKKLMGREKGAKSYSAEEHVYLLSGMKTITNSFNASESSPELLKVCPLQGKCGHNNCWQGIR